MPEQTDHRLANQRPEAPLLAIMPRWLVITLAILSFFAPTGLVIFLLAKPDSVLALQTLLGRSLLIIAISLYLAVFLFVLYPQQLKITKIPVVGIPLTIVGLPVLWMAFFLFLDKAAVPLPAHGVLFQPRFEGQEVDVRIGAISLLAAPGEEAPTYFKVPENGDDRQLSAIYVVFNAGRSSSKANIRVTGRKDQIWTFNRQSGIGVFEIGEIDRPPLK